MAFDAAGAKAAGYSDAEIAAHVAQTGEAVLNSGPGPQGGNSVSVDVQKPDGSWQSMDGGMSVAEKMNNPYFDINTPEALRAEMKKNAQPVIDSMNPVQKGIVGVGAGMYDAYKGVQQAGAEVGQALGMVKPETVARITQEGQDARNDFAPLKDQSTAATIGEFGGKIAPYLALPAGGTGALARFAMGAGTGAAMGATEFVPQGGSRGMNTLMGGAMGGAGSAVLSGAGKLYNAAAENPLARFATQKLSEKFKIPVTLSELSGGANRTDTIMERVPSFFGIKGFREGQQQAAKEAATTHFGQYVIDPTLDSTAAMKVANDAHLDGLYQTVRANSVNMPQATAPEVQRVAGEILDRYPGVFDSIQDGHVKKILMNIYGDAKDQVTHVPGSPAPAVNIGNSAPTLPTSTAVAPKFSFDDLWTLRKGIGAEIGDASTNTARSQMNALYSAVSTDMDAMLAGKGGNALQEFKVANDAFKQYSLKFDAMRQAYDKAMGTTGAGTMGFFSPQKYGTALKNLANDPTYKRNVKWTPKEVGEMTGLANILQVTKRAGQFMENPPTGNRFAPASILQGLIGGAGGAAGVAYGGAAATAQTGAVMGTAALVTKFLTTTQSGKRLALSASRIEPQSKAMGMIMNQIYSQLPKVTAEAGIEALQPKPKAYTYRNGELTAQ